MNPFRWFLKLSADLAQKRGGSRDPWAYSYDATVDSRDYEEWIEVDGATLFVGNKKWPECWSQLSPDSRRYARAIEAGDGSFRLTVYARQDSGHNGPEWGVWEGPSVLATREEAMALGQQLLIA